MTKREAVLEGRVAVLLPVVEDMAGMDCAKSGRHFHQKPCGACLSCRARLAISVGDDDLTAQLRQVCGALAGYEQTGCEDGPGYDCQKCLRCRTRMALATPLAQAGLKSQSRE